MKKFLPLVALVMTGQAVSAQYKNDNVAFRTVYPADLCEELARQKDFLLLDVRSSGEYADTSARGLNLGQFKNAVNIEVNELGRRIAEVAAFRDKPVYVYCSHSQRSRRASKMLADSGFRNVININGGMTAVRNIEDQYCIQQSLEGKTGYRYISLREICRRMGAFTIVDVRPDSAYRHISLDAKTNAYGYFKNSISIPLDQLKQGISKVPADKPVVVMDLYGIDAAKAAGIFKQAGYNDVFVLPEGMDRYILSNKKELPCSPGTYVSAAKFNITNSQELGEFMAFNKDPLIIDLRSAEEFNNKHTNSWMNIGHVQGAVNIQPADLKLKLTELEQYKNRPVLIYGFGSGTSIYEAASLLANNGFTKVNLLAGGLFSIRWTAANVKGYSAIKDLVVDVPAENL